MRFRDEKAEDLDQARAEEARWRAEHTEGTAAQLVDQVGAGFHPDWAPVLRAMLFAVDRRRVRQVTGLATRTASTAP